MNCEDLSLNSLISQRNENRVIYSIAQKPCPGEQLDFGFEDNVMGASLINTTRYMQNSLIISQSQKQGDFSFNEDILSNSKQLAKNKAPSQQQNKNSDSFSDKIVYSQKHIASPYLSFAGNSQKNITASVCDDMITLSDYSALKESEVNEKDQYKQQQSNVIFQNLLKKQFTSVQADELQTKDQNYQKKLEKINPLISQKMWRFKFFRLLLLTNRFLHKMKKTLIFSRPHLLQKEQAEAINDKCAFNVIQQSSFKSYNIGKRNKFLKKLNILLLGVKKNLKVVSKPLLVCQNYFHSKWMYISSFFEVFQPFSPLMIVWDIIFMINIILNLINIPLEVSFKFGSNDTFNISNYIIIITNILIHINTSFYYRGEPQTNRWMILKNYLKEQAFDEVLSIICLYWKSPFRYPVFRIAYLVKIKQLGKLADKLREYFQTDDKYAQVTNLALLLIQILYLCHMFACLWYKIGIYIQNELNELSWLEKFKDDDLSQELYYVNSIYYAVITIITIGYGDITPIHFLEKIFIIVMAFLSCVNFGYALNQIGEIIKEINLKKQKYRIQIAGINKYMKEMQVTHSLQSQARKYLEYAYAENFNQDYSQMSALENLSINLQNLIKKEVHMRYLREIPCISSNFSPEFLERISLFFKEKSFGSGETILDQNEQKTPCIYVVMRGKVQISLKLRQSQDLKKFKRLKVQQCFGLYEFFSQNLQSIYSVNSIGISTLLLLNLEDFLKQLEDFPKDKETYYLLKDKLNLFNQIDNIGLECLSCKSSGHLLNQCRVLSYQPNKLKLIQDYIQREEDEIKRIRRNQNVKFNSLNKSVEVKYIIEDIQQNGLFEEDSQKQIDDVKQIIDSSTNIGSQRSKSQSAVLIEPKSFQLISHQQIQTNNNNNINTPQIKQSIGNNSKLNIKFNDVEDGQNKNPISPRNHCDSVRLIEKKHTILCESNTDVLQNYIPTEQKNEKIIPIMPHKRTSIMRQTQKSQKNQIMLNNDNFQNSDQLIPIPYSQNLISNNNNEQLSQHNQHSQHNQQNSNNLQDMIKEMIQAFNFNLNIPNMNNYRKSFISGQIHPISQIENHYVFQTESIKSYKIYFPHNNLEVVTSKLNFNLKKGVKRNGTSKSVRSKAQNHMKQSNFFQKKE